VNSKHSILNSKDILEQDSDHVWHPMMNHYNLKEDPLKIMTQASGCRIVDSEGKEYLDAMAGLWCVNIGYGRKEIAEAAYEQMVELSYYPLSQINPQSAKLASKISEITPKSLQHIWFVNSGSEAVDTAIKISRAWGKRNGGRFKIIARYQGYHGATFGGVSLTGQTQRRLDFEPLLPGVVHVQAPYFYRSSAKDEDELTDRCIEELDSVIRYQGPETIAAFIAEPIIGGGGVILPSRNYLKRVREVCDRYGILMICDEVITGFGRTGELFASQLFEVQPDIMTMAKGLSSGYLPIGATAVSDQIFLDLNSEGDTGFLQINTYGGHPVSCAAAIKNLEILLGEKMVENCRAVGKHLGDTLTKLNDYPCVGEVRGVGLLWGVELIEEDGTPLSTQATSKILSFAKSKGVILGKNAGIANGPSNTITISPPLILSKQEADLIGSVLSDALRNHLS
tara:strand:+ start:4686 stop:6044 length:1359 start_codon:yes stop_codon:yes gene_type:complete